MKIEKTITVTYIEATDIVNGTVIIPDNVTSIGNSAFKECSGLTSIIIPNGVTSIGDGAFRGCSGLTSIVIPFGVTSIGSSAFLGCNKLVEVYNLSSLNITKGSSNNGYVGYYAKDIYTDKSTPSKLTTDENGYMIYSDGEEKILIGYTGQDTALILPSYITEINRHAFYANNKITSVVIPENVKSIGDEAFCKCGKLFEIYNLSSLKITKGSEDYGYVGYYAKDIYTDKSTPSKLTIDENGYMLYSNGEKRILIGYVGQDTALTLPSGITEIDQAVFYGNDKITSVTIPSGVTSINDGAFSECSKLTSIVIPDSVTSIGDYAFSNCSGLTSIVIPDGVTNINYGAFTECKGLTSIVIPDSLMSIDEWAFDGCSRLTTVYYGGSATDKAKISISSYNCNLTDATWYYYSESKPVEAGKYWHYVDNTPTVWENQVPEDESVENGFAFTQGFARK